MTSQSNHGFLQIPHGRLFWKHDTAGVVKTQDKPTLVFIHAGVADHTLWDEQIKYFAHRNWDCLRFDLFGYGESRASEAYLLSSPRARVDYIDHVHTLIEVVLGSNAKVVLIGLSKGGCLSLGYTLHHPRTVVGLCSTAGGVGGFDLANTPEEDALFGKVGLLIDSGDIAAAAKLQTRVWGDGLHAEEGRLADLLVERMIKWDLEICAREHARTGGDVFENNIMEPDHIERLHEVKIPTAVAYGTYYETNTTGAMKHLGSSVVGAVVQEFEAGHMVNLEFPAEFNEFVGHWLSTNFAQENGLVS